MKLLNSHDDCLYASFELNDLDLIINLKRLLRSNSNDYSSSRDGEYVFYSDQVLAELLKFSQYVQDTMRTISG